MYIPRTEGITPDQWKALDGYFNRKPKRFFYGTSLEACMESFLEINALRRENTEEAERREKVMFEILHYHRNQ